MTNRTSRVLASGTLVLGLGLVGAACNVEQTREGRLPDVSVDGDSGELPEFAVKQTQHARLPDVDVDVDVKKGSLPRFDIDKTEEGRLPSVDVDVRGGQLPGFEVEGPDVEVKTRTIEVTVPDVDVELPKDGPDGR